jgi:hypothetical protein
MLFNLQEKPRFELEVHYQKNVIEQDNGFGTYGI